MAYNNSDNGNAAIASTQMVVIRKRRHLFQLRREVEMFDHIRTLTTIPIPEVLASGLDGEDIDCGSGLNGDDMDWGWVVLQLGQGRPLSQVWPNMSAIAKGQTIAELRYYLQQLRRIQPPNPGVVESYSGGPVYDDRFHTLQTYGPFASVREFNDFLAAPVTDSEMYATYRKRLLDDYETVFTHSNMS